MSFTAKLEIYNLQIREKGDKNKFVNLKDVSGFNFIEEVNRYLTKNVYLFKIDNENERTSRIEKIENVGDELYCRIKVGRFGQSSEIVDTQSGSGIFHKEREHSDTIPLFFSIKITKDNFIATLEVERVGSYTLLPNVRNILNFVLNDIRNDKYVIEIRPLKQAYKIEDFISKKLGKIQSVNLILKDSLDSELMEPIVIKLKSKYRKDLPENLKDLVFKSSKDLSYTRFKEFLPKNLKEIEIQNVLLDIKINDKGSLKLNINDEISISSNKSKIMNKTELDKFGHPGFNSMIEFSKKSH
ncbi:MAG: hypothetical protein JXR64_03355 [Spirochaetales bacterium]|nr:hypothetical protein [Spirochaetales bacterium]